MKMGPTSFVHSFVRSFGWLNAFFGFVSSSLFVRIVRSSFVVQTFAAASSLKVEVSRRNTFLRKGMRRKGEVDAGMIRWMTKLEWCQVGRQRMR